MKCLVTGSAGYIGSHVLSRFVSKGYDVIGTYYNKKPTILNDDVTLIQGDISNNSLYKSLPNDIDIIVHCASLVRDYGPKKRFYEVNVKGTKNLVDYAKKCDISQFIYLGHIKYESNHLFNYYSESKSLSQSFLLDEYNNNKFPVSIICPGNVFGPGAHIWLIRILNTMMHNKLYLINQGDGIFHHTYIDNLIDAIALSLNNSSAIGHVFNITDGDTSITFQKYFTDLAEIINVSKSFKNMSKKSALRIGFLMNVLNRLTGYKPIITPLAVEILTNHMSISIEPASSILSYKPKVQYDQAMKHIEQWITKEFV